jgi:hypothetical protein
MAGLLDWITGAVQQQYAKGAPYREAVSGLLQGDPTKFGLLAQEFNRKAQTPEGALDVALNFAPLGVTKIVNPKTQYEIAQEVAQRRAALPVSEGGLGLPANNTAMDRAIALEYDTPAYTGMNIEDEIESMLPKSWFSKQPEYASTYSTTIPSDGISKDPRVYPVLLRTGKVKSQPHFGLYQDMEKALSKKGIDTFKVENVGTGTNDFYVTKDPSQVRSIYAAFDPFRRNEADILAGLLAVPATSLMQAEDKKKKRNTK